MERSINKATRDTVVILFLACAFIALLWAPFEWISNMYTNQEEVNREAWRTAQKFQLLWPLSVGTLLAFGYFTYWAQLWVLGVFVPTILTAGFIGVVCVLAYYIPPIMMMFIPGGFLAPYLFIVIWPYIFYRLLRTIIVRWLQPYSNFTHSRLQHFALFSLFAIPEILCQFGFFTDYFWYVVFL